MSYYITSIDQAEAMPFVLDHMLKIGTLFDEEWAQNYQQYVQWFGAHDGNETRGVLGVMTCSAMPDDLIIVGLYGNPMSIKILGDFSLRMPQKHKFGYVDVRNIHWISALTKRGFTFEEVSEWDRVGNEIKLVRLTGD